MTRHSADRLAAMNPTVGALRECIRQRRRHATEAERSRINASLTAYQVCDILEKAICERTDDESLGGVKGHLIARNILRECLDDQPHTPIITRLVVGSAPHLRHVVSSDTGKTLATDLDYGEASAVQFYLHNPREVPPTAKPQIVDRVRTIRDAHMLDIPV